jgi:hypothetical protein
MSGVTLPTNARFKNLKGMKFGRLSVVEYAGRQGKQSRWKCSCDCGEIKTVQGNNLSAGHTKSCGCFNKEMTLKAHTKHGDSGSPEHSAWRMMIHRCQNPANNQYPNYGGRGINVCDRWQSYEEFLKDMGRRPTPVHSIDRIDNSAGYSPVNCRWATKKEQSRNTRSNRLVTHNAVTRCLTEWAELSGLNVNTLRSRLRLGWTFERAITTPKQGVNND